MPNPYLLIVLISIAVTVAYGAGRRWSERYPLWLILAFAFSMQLTGYYCMSMITSLVIL